MRALLISAATDAGAIKPLPLGLACVAAATELAGHEVRLLALDAGAAWQTDLRRALQALSPDVIGLSVRNIDDQNRQSPRFLLADLKPIVALCRDCSSSPIVLGGAGYSIFPAPALAYLGADFGIRGEGEAAFPALLAWLSRGRQSAPPPAVYLAHGGSGRPGEFAPDLTRFPLPPPRLWLDFPNSRAMRVPVQSRRGCPLECAYCSSSAIEGWPVRQRAAASLIPWLAALRQAGFQKFHFVDNIFNLPLPYAKDLCRELIAARLGLDWWAIIYPKWVDGELTELMAQAGCTQVSLGFETGAPAMLPQLNKQFTCEEVRAASAALAGVGIKRQGFLLLGGPGETRATVEQSLAFADSLRLDGLSITVGLRIYPDTPLASAAVADGLVQPGEDLLMPRFYLTPALRDWLPERIALRTHP